MIQSIWEQALAMPAEERAALARDLIHSLDMTVEAEFGAMTEEQWHREIVARLASIESGECIPVDWQVAIEEDRKEFEQGRNQ